VCGGLAASLPLKWNRYSSYKGLRAIHHYRRAVGHLCSTLFLHQVIYSIHWYIQDVMSCFIFSYTT
jgi:hypothetical protein